MLEASDELVRTRYTCYLNALGKMADAQLELAGKTQIIFTAYKVCFCFTLLILIRESFFTLLIKFLFALWVLLWVYIILNNYALVF